MDISPAVAMIVVFSFFGHSTSHKWTDFHQAHQFQETAGTVMGRSHFCLAAIISLVTSSALACPNIIDVKDWTLTS